MNTNIAMDDVNKILQSLSFNANIAMSDITELYNFMNKQNKVKTVCDINKIKQRSDDSRYYIYISRKQIIGNSYTDLIEKLYDMHFGDTSLTLEDLFSKWLIWRRDNTKISNKSLKEYSFLWNSMFKDSSIAKIPIKTIKPNDFIVLFRNITKDGNITRKRFNDGKSILNGIYYYAIEMQLVDVNPLRDINYRIFNYKPINDYDNVYTLEERKKIIECLKSKDDIYSLGILLHFHIVARIGELKSLRWQDITNGFIRIQTQVLDEQTMNDDLTFNPRMHKQVDYVKGNTSCGYRNIPLTPTAIEILKRIKTLNPESDYILSNNNQPFTTITYNRRLKKYCNEIGVPYKSSHKIRFTVASMLYQSGVEATKIQEWLGHTTLSMTLHYLRSVTTEKESYNKMISILG